MATDETRDEARRGGMLSSGAQKDPRPAVGKGGPWVQVELGSALSRGGEPAQVFVAVDPETGKRWTGLVILDPEGLTIAKLRNLQSYVEQGLEAAAFMDVAGRELSAAEVLLYRPPQRVVFDERFFTWLVAFYKLAVDAHPERAVAFMAETIDRPLVTVARWVSAARRRGLLGPDEARRTKGGKHGK